MEIPVEDVHDSERASWDMQTKAVGVSLFTQTV